jgi:hypothetical protein
MLEYKMKVDFDGGRWFQVAVTPELKLEFKMNPNTLVVSLEERGRVLAAVTTAVEAILRYNNNT